MDGYRVGDLMVRWLGFTCLLLGCAHPATSKPAGHEHRVSGHLFRSEAYCNTPPTPPRRQAGPVRIYGAGRRGYGVPGELVLIVQADEEAGYEVFLPPGIYCFAGGESRFCNVEVEVTRNAPLYWVDVYYQVGPGGPCEY